MTMAGRNIVCLAVVLRRLLCVVLSGVRHCVTGCGVSGVARLGSTRQRSVNGQHSRMGTARVEWLGHGVYQLVYTGAAHSVRCKWMEILRCL